MSASPAHNKGCDAFDGFTTGDLLDELLVRMHRTNGLEFCEEEDVLAAVGFLQADLARRANPTAPRCI